MVFEHPGAATFPVSALVVKRGGMVVICAGTTGYKLTVDARYPVDAPEAPAGQPFRQPQAGLRPPTDSCSTARSIPA